MAYPVRRRTETFLVACAVAGLLACGGAGPGVAVKAGTDSKGWYLDAELQSLIDKTTKSRVTTGNSVNLLINGVEAFARRYRNLATAKFVLVKTFIWTDDDAGRKLADAIIAKARAGVPVIVQYDVKGQLGSAADIADMLSRSSTALPVGEPKVIADMRAAGVEIVDTNSPGRPLALKEWVDNTKRFFRDPAAALKRSRESLVLFDHVDHDKYFVTVHDGGEVRAILGGLNIASEYSLGGVPDQKDSKSGRQGWRDTDVEVVGPAAHVVIEEFLADIKRHRGEAAPKKLVAKLRKLATVPRRAGRLAVRVITNNPLFDKTRHIDDIYRILILATPKTEPIFLSTPYFAPSKRLRGEMLTHMRGGGTITVLTNSYDSNDTDILTDAARYSAKQLMVSSNFRLIERKPRPDLGETMLHHKVASFGHHGPVIIGSPNLDAQSFIHNAEALIVVQDAAFRRRFDAMVADDIASDRATNITKEMLDNASTAERIRSFAAAELAWYWL